MILLIAMLLTPQGPTTQTYRLDSMTACEKALPVVSAELRKMNMPWGAMCVQMQIDFGGT